MTDYELHHGDCLDILPTLAPQSIDAVICDPPYGTTACKWDSVIPFEPMWSGIKRVLRPRGACVLFGSQPFTSALVMSNPKWFKYEWVWVKNRGSNFGNVRFQPMKEHEAILVFAYEGPEFYPQKQLRTRTIKEGYTNYGNTGKRQAMRKSFVNKGFTIVDGVYRCPGSVQECITEVGLHPTQKPLALLEYLVRTYTNAGDTVLDFAFGSGTTGHACGNLGRRFVGIERDKAYFDLASERIATAYAPLRMMQAAI